MDQGLGKIIRLNDDGSVPADNPFQTDGDLARSFWSIGHRNALGLAFDADGQLWAHEMGPRDGDELNIIHKGANYGWPIVSEGEHYNGTAIPSHATRPDINSTGGILDSNHRAIRIGFSMMAICFRNGRGDALLAG